MAGLGMLMILVGAWSLWLCWRGQDKLFNSKAFLRLILLVGPSGLIAIPAGWFATEMGYQPWVVYGLMCIADAFSAQSVTQTSPTLLTSMVVYPSLSGIGIGYMMYLVRKGPVTHEGRETNPRGAGQKRTPARPLSTAGEGFDEEHDGHVQAADRDQDKGS